MKGMALAYALSFLVSAAVVFELRQRGETNDAVGLGLNLVRVAVATHALSAHSVVREGDIEITEVPRRFTTASNVVESDAPKLVGQAISVPIERGDAVVWSMFADTRRVERIVQCVQAIHEQVAQARAADGGKSVAAQLAEEHFK